jgi:hypothetical protein
VDTTALKQLDIAEVAERLGGVNLKRSARGYVGLCPLHTERTPSFSIDEKTNRYKCFGCGEGGDVIDLVRKLTRCSFLEAADYLQGNAGHIKPVKRREEQPAPKGPDFIPQMIVRPTLAAFRQSSFYTYLAATIGTNQADIYSRDYYGTGATKNGEVIFWYHDYNGRPRTGKAVTYDAITGKRNRDVNMWQVHTSSVVQKQYGRPYNAVPCLFGEHLLTLLPDQVVGVVESEKTAMLAAHYLDHLDMVWLATGGLDRLNFDKHPERFEVLRGRRVLLYPDSHPAEHNVQPFKTWSHQAGLMNAAGFKVAVVDILEHLPESEKAQKPDIADYLTRNAKT